MTLVHPCCQGFWYKSILIFVAGRKVQVIRSNKHVGQQEIKFQGSVLLRRAFKVCEQWMLMNLH